MVNRPILCVFLKASADVYNDRNFLLSCEQSIDGIAVERTDYTYDVAGNRLTETKTTYAVAMESGKDETTTVLTNTYDLSNRLVKSVTKDAVINNTYNAAGYRVSKAVTKNGTTTKTYFLYDGNNVIMEADEDGVTAKNTYGGPLLLRTVFGEEDTEEKYQYMYNAHGDVVTLLTDGAVVATYYYDSFGNILDQTGEVDNSILYAGYQYDEETGLYYINARMYDPVTARFIQADTYLGNLNDPLSLNLYTYCLNNPHKYVDPSGHSVVVLLLMVIASGVLAASMEYINQRFIEQRDVINYDQVLRAGLFNAAITIVTFGFGSLGVTASMTGTQIIAGSMAFGAAEGALDNISRQMVDGVKLSELDYGQVAIDATIGAFAGWLGAYASVGDELIGYAGTSTKGSITKYAHWNVGADDVVDAGMSGSYMRYAGISENGGAYRSGETTLNDWINRIPDLSKQAPIEIPSTATVKAQAKNGYDQISFKWTESGQNYEVRWHTKTPGAPEGQGNTWVVSRITPGTPTGRVRTEHILVGDTWVPRHQWQDAINVYRNGTATREQMQLLKDGHWQAP